NWPIGCGRNFKGVYDRETEMVELFTATAGGTKAVAEQDVSIHDAGLKDMVGFEYYDKLQE
ncbi:MAG TPA: peptide chain release factor 3, partial [Oribacterium sp.]|nr:peptide chain release factor 3 [Oribacterium sp.]